MKASEIIKQIVETNGCVLIRNRREEHIKGTDWQYDVKGPFEGNKRGWVLVDLTTAGAMFAVFNALSPENQSKWDHISFNRLVDFTWKNVH